METFLGYRRSDGRVGVRNTIAVVPLSVAASAVATAIADGGPERARATPHQLAADAPAPALEQGKRVLTGIGTNPNVCATVFVSLGTEVLDAEALADEVAATGRPVETLSVRECNGTRDAVDTGISKLADLAAETADTTREEAPVSELIVGVECGGSDATSGLASNPAVGEACDTLIEAGGTASFSETPEFIGAEHILADRCANDDVRERLLAAVDRREGMADLMGVDLRGAQPSPGNQEGGLTTIEEKSLGAIVKGGTTEIQDIVSYGEQLPTEGGLVIMDTPGYDVESVVGKVAGGAQLIVFTTGRGSTTGNPIAPVIKVCGNPQTWERMASNMDVNASTIIGGDDLEDVGDRLFETIVETANGQQTAAEARGMHEFAINERLPNEIERFGETA
ncbi:UxaA family hydrolase [Natronolimnobius sp. AArcel1]|uniref:UxaA family hydrolase n=1 Tax=Natronolimnobius sp. AArcel1 TaxID=1679093 RepID=UPI0013EE35B8|nr:UxaA family hydrolase [Natronolimnobius sp. AArcel1]NGM70523.1 UxaA family hydrolase [Natronolimnobius sp. AArcel1]